jgi:hypothetical protein
MKIYVDMDGVIADFFTELARHYGVDHWKDLNDKEAAIMALCGTDFFGSLPKFETSDDLIRYVDMITEGEWCILSSPLSRDVDNCSFWKKHWLDKNGYMPKEAIFTHNKADFANDGFPNILIDDHQPNIDAWNKAGGIGIRYQANKDSLFDVMKFINDFYF